MVHTITCKTSQNLVYKDVQGLVVVGEVLSREILENLVEIFVEASPVILINFQQLTFYLFLNMPSNRTSMTSFPLRIPIPLDNILQMYKYLSLSLGILGLGEDGHQ